MTSRRRDPRMLIGALTALLVTALAAETVCASSFEYSSEKRLIKVANLLVQSARAKSGAGNPPSRLNLENPDPHIFWALERSPWKPPNWEFVNPLAPAVVTEEVQARWDFRYAPGFGDPNYGSPGSRVVELGDPLPKWSGAYWEVLLAEENFNALLGYDLLLITNHSLTAFSAADRELLRRLVDAGATVMIDDCGGMRIVHATDDGQVPQSDFDMANASSAEFTNNLLETDSGYFGVSFFSRWGGGRDNFFDLPVSAQGFFTDLQFFSDGNPSGHARASERYSPLVTTPYWLSQTELNELGDKSVTQYRIACYDRNTLFPVVMNSAYAAETTEAPYGEPYVAMGYYGEGIIIATAGDVGCAVNDGISSGYVYRINNQNNSGYWCGSDFSSIDDDPRGIGNVKFMINAVNLAAKYRAGFGGPRQQASLATQTPNALNPAASAALAASDPGDYWSAYAGHAAGHSYATSANNVVYVVVPLPGERMYLVALDGVTGRDFDADGNPDDGLQGSHADPDLALFGYPEWDLLWAEELQAPGGDPTATAPVVGKAAYSTGSPARWYAADVVYVAANNRLYAYEALPMNAGLVADAAVLFDGWSAGSNPVTLSERATGLTYCRNRLYVETADGATPVEVEIIDANDGDSMGTIEVPGVLGTLADAGAGPAIAVVADTYNGAQDEMLYLPVSPDGATMRAQVLAIALQTWNERMRPVGRTSRGTDAGSVAIDACYRNWRIREFARFDNTAAAPKYPTLYVNGVLVPREDGGTEVWRLVDDTGGADPDIPGGDVGDCQQIRFMASLVNRCPGGTTEGVPADAQVLVSYEHKLPSHTSFPIPANEAGSIKWRYILAKRTAAAGPGDVPTYTVDSTVTQYTHARVAVDAQGTVAIAVPLNDAAGWSDTFHVIHDIGYPTDLLDIPEAGGGYGVEPEPTTGTASQWDGDEVDQVGSFVFWQESPRPLMGYVLQFADRTWTGGYPWDRAPSFAINEGKAVIRTSQQIADAPADWYSSYTTADLEAVLSVTLGRGDGGGVDTDGNLLSPARPMPALRAEWSTADPPIAPGDPPALAVPYGVRIFDAWTGARIPCYLLANGAPATWWVEPKTGTIHFVNANLAGRRILVQVCDNNGTPADPAEPDSTDDDVYYHEYHQVPPIVIGQFPSMAIAPTSGAALDRPVYTGDAPFPADGAPAGDMNDILTIARGAAVGVLAEDAITPLAVDWDNGLISFWPCQSIQSVDVNGTTAGVEATFGSDPLVRSAAPPVIAGSKVLAHGWLGTQGSAQAPSHGIVTLQLDPRDSSEQSPEQEPWPASAGVPPPWWGGDRPGAPWPTYNFRDEGAGDGYNLYWAGEPIPSPGSLENPCYDLLGISRGATAVTTDIAVPRAAPVVTSDGKGVLTAVLDDDGASYQWWNTVETVIACQNRLLVVDSGRGVVRDIPSTGISEVLGNLTLPSADLEASQSSFRGISRPSSIRDLSYVGKRGVYYLCDSGNDQVLEIDKTGGIAVRISNRLREPWGGGTPWVNAAFYDVPGWYAELPVGSPATISAPHDAYRWECTSTITYPSAGPGGSVTSDWRFEFDWIADTGNNRLLGLMRQIPDDPSIVSSRADQHHLVYVSDAFQAVLDGKGQRIERGPALQYTSCWPLRAPAPLSETEFIVSDADPSSPPLQFAGGAFAGIVAAVNNVALSTVPGDPENMPDLVNADGGPRTDPYPRNLGPGSSVVQVGRLYDSDGDNTLDRIDDQIQWAFSEIYTVGLAPNGQPSLVPFRKLKRINYIDVELRTGPDVPTGDPAV